MADRTVYGLNFSENGWRMVDQGSCVWVTVPGTNVSLQIREGQPAKILGAFAADWNAYIEPLRDADSACWTATNSVASSNHLSGTACDLNWNSHPFRVANAGFNGAQLATMREMLDFYEDLVFWGNNWDNPKDAMHVQMNGDTYGSDNVEKVNDFISRKIRADGFSTFRRGGTPAPPPSASKADQYALAIIAEGRRRGVTPRGIQIALSVALVESGMKNYANSNVPESLNIPHDAVGSDHDSLGLFQQRCPMWGPAEVLMNPALSAGLFYDRLTKLNYNDPNRLPGDFAADVQRPAAQYRGRYQERMGDAVALYNRLSGTAPPTQGEDELSAEAERKIDAIYQEVTKRFHSRSPLRHLGEGEVDTMAGFLLNVDSSQHVEIVRLLAGYGHPPTLALLQEVANADPNQYPDRQADRLLAQAILADVTSAPASTPNNNVTVNAATPAPPPFVYRDIPAPVKAEVAVAEEATTGQLIGRVYDDLEKLRLADALPIEGRAPLAALIAVLNTKNGSQL